LHGRRREPVTFPATRVTTFPQIMLNELIPDAAVQFAPRQKRTWSQSSRTTLIFAPSRKPQECKRQM
jgi:hypothetical protein